MLCLLVSFLPSFPLRASKKNITATCKKGSNKKRAHNRVYHLSKLMRMRRDEAVCLFDVSVSMCAQNRLYCTRYMASCKLAMGCYPPSPSASFFLLFSLTSSLPLPPISSSFLLVVTLSALVFCLTSHSILSISFPCIFPFLSFSRSSLPLPFYPPTWYILGSNTF